MLKFAEERDAAFIDFVKTGNSEKVMAYCRKYGVPVPRDYKVFAAGIYKAVQECVSIPEDIKTLAMWRCISMGFNPLMRPYDMPEKNND